jgi:competence protein ComEA
MLLAALLLVVAYWWWQGRMRPVVAIPDAVPVLEVEGDAPALAEVTVHVRGRVADPGVVTLPQGSRVKDAIEAAGGLRARASSGDLNLARVLVDGEQISVGVRVSSGGAVAGTPGPSGEGPPALVDLNAASPAELESLPGIGPVLAQRITQWRVDNGPFTAVDVLSEVSGIGDALMARLRPLVRV